MSMNKDAQEQFEVLMNRDINDLSDDDKAFIYARSSYLNPVQLQVYKNILDEQALLLEDKLRLEEEDRLIEKTAEEKSKLDRQKKIEAAKAFREKKLADAKKALEAPAVQETK